MVAAARGTSATINPIDYPDAWNHFVIASKPSPGCIAPGGVSGFKRETGWDKKKGKGSVGASLSVTSYPPAEGSFAVQLWRPEHFRQWAEFAELLQYDPAKAIKDRPAVDLYYPSLADLKIGSVVTKSVSPITHMGKKLYVVTVELIEWRIVPAVSIVATPTSSKNNDPSSLPGAAPDPIGDAQQREIAALLKQATAPPPGAVKRFVR